MRIVQYPHPTLRHVSKPLRKVDAELCAMVDEMFDLMYEAKGVGLAANQVDLPYRLFVANPTGDPDLKEDQHVFLNPVIKRHKGGGAEHEEGCLSIPGVYEDVKRPESVVVNAYNLSGEEITLDLNGLFARVVQHEIDHLDGVLFIDRLPTTKASSIADALEEFELTFRGKQTRGEEPDHATIAARLAKLEKLRT